MTSGWLLTGCDPEAIKRSILEPHLAAIRAGASLPLDREQYSANHEPFREVVLLVAEAHEPVAAQRPRHRATGAQR